MSKAFTKEDSGGEDISLKPEGPALPPGAKNYMTPAGAKRLSAELDQLLHSPIDVQRKSELRIRYLQQRISDLQVINPLDQPAGKVRFGATVTICDEEGVEHTYRIVGIDEADAKQGRLSWVSPLATAMLGAGEGDSVTVKTPKGEKEWEIVKIFYEVI